MTTLLGLKLDDGTVYLATDRRVSRGSIIISEKTNKIVTLGEWRIAYAGQTFGQRLIETMEARDFPTAFDLVLAIRARFSEPQWGWSAGKEDRGVSCFGTNLLLARPGELWMIGQDFSAVPIEAGVVSGGGAGDETAMGAATAFLEAGRTPAEALHGGVRIAGKYHECCGTEPEVVEIRAQVASFVPSGSITSRFAAWNIAAALRDGRLNAAGSIEREFK